MKKVFFVIALALLSTSLFAQNGFGVKAGLNFNSMSDISLNDPKGSYDGKTGFHVGAFYKVGLPLGFALQPELLYTQKGGTVASLPDVPKTDVKMHYVQLPVNIQWGVDLVLFRPFLLVSPYIGYAIAKGDGFSDIKWSNFNKFEYGIGLGAGLEVWKFQVSGRYCWDLGKIGTFKEDMKNLNSVMKDAKNKGFELSIAYIF